MPGMLRSSTTTLYSSCLGRRRTQELERAASACSASSVCIPHEPSCSRRIRRFVALSSTISTRKPASSAGFGRSVAGFACLPRRSSNQKVLPTSTSLSTPTRPPMSSTSCLTIASPKPVPPKRRGRGRVEPARTDRTGDRGRGGDTHPGVTHLESPSRLASASSSRSRTRMTTSPRSVNFTAFEVRFSRI